MKNVIVFFTTKYSPVTLLGNSIKTTYTPCGRFWKSVPQGECRFANAPVFCVTFRYDLSQRE